jgi:transposase
MAGNRRYPPEVRERAVRLVFENEEEYASRWETIRSIAAKFGCSPETLRSWIKQVEIDSGRHAGLTTEERSRIKELEREVRELRRANEILRQASAFFAQAELDRQPK